MRLEALRAIAAAAAFAAAVACAQARDVVIVGGAITEIVYALGAESRIAATDTTSIYPAGAAHTVKVGYQRTLSAEGILALQPKLILAAHEAGPPAALASIRGAGVEIVSFAQDNSFEGMKRRVATVAAKLGREEQGRALVRSLDADWARVSAAVAARKGKPRVLFLLAHAGPVPQAAGEGTTADAMIRLAGGVNVMAGAQGYKPVTAEGMVNAAPDVILITDQGLDAQGGIDALLKRPGFAMTPAGRDRKVVALEALYLMGFGPRLPAAVEELSVAIHGRPRS